MDLLDLDCLNYRDLRLRSATVFGDHENKKTLQKVRGMLNVSIISSCLWITYKRRFAHSVIINGSHTSSCPSSTGYEPGDAPDCIIIEDKNGG